MQGDVRAIVCQVVRVDQALPFDDARRGLIRGGRQHGPKARAVLEFVGDEIPFEGADGGGVEGESQAFIGDFQHHLDTAAFIIFFTQETIGGFGVVEAGTRLAGEVDAQA